MTTLPPIAAISTPPLGPSATDTAREILQEAIAKHQSEFLQTVRAQNKILDKFA